MKRWHEQRERKPGLRNTVVHVEHPLARDLMLCGRDAYEGDMRQVDYRPVSCPSCAAVVLMCKAIPRIKVGSQAQAEDARQGAAEESGMNKRIICLDFDGVINSYSTGWAGADKVLDPVVPGFVQWLARADLFFAIAIYSSRSHQPGGIEAMQTYVRRAIDDYFDVGFGGDPRDGEYADKLYGRIQWPTYKPSAFISIDDRALTFTGDWRDFEPQDLTDFLPWNKNPKLGAKGMPQSTGSTAVANQRKSLIRRILTGWMWALSRRPRSPPAK